MEAYGIEAFTTDTDPFTFAFKKEVEDFQVTEIDLNGEEAIITDTSTLPSPLPDSDLPNAIPSSQPASPARIRNWATATPLDSILSEDQLCRLEMFAAKGTDDIPTEGACPIGVISDKATRAAMFASVKQRWPFLTTKAATVDGQCTVEVIPDRHYYKLRPLLGDKETSLVVQFATECLPDNPKAVNVASGAARESRTSIHLAIAECYPFLKTRTLECLGKTCISVYPGSNTNRDRKRKHSEASAKGQRWLQFVLQKRNMETMDVVTRLSSFCHTHPSSFSFAGIKDKRGITTQFFTACATSVKPKRLLAINETELPLKVGNLKYVPKPLSNGQLFGNRFTVVLRDISAPAGTVEAAIKATAERGFVNYYGPQRFGDDRYEVQIFCVGKMLLQQKWKEAVEMLLYPDPQSPEDILKAKQHWAATQDAQGTLKLMPAHRQTEVQILKNLHRYAELPNVHEKALMAIPHTMRTMMLHSYCSYIWNCAATARVLRHGLKVIPGDLVITDPTLKNHDEEKTTDDAEMERVPPHVVTAEEAATGTYRIEQVVLPMPGKHSLYPQNDIGDVFQELMRKDGIEPEMLAQKILQVALPGAYRNLVTMPMDLQFAWVSEQQNKDGDDAQVAEELPGQKGTQLRLHFTLPRAAYATIMLREICKSPVLPSYPATPASAEA